MSNKELPGNSVASAALFTREMVALAEQLIRFSDKVDRLIESEASMGNLTLRPPRVPAGEWLCVCRLRSEGVWYVAFVSARSLSEVLRLVAAKWENGSLQWREDDYAKTN